VWSSSTTPSACVVHTAISFAASPTTVTWRSARTSSLAAGWSVVCEAFSAISKSARARLSRTFQSFHEWLTERPDCTGAIGIAGFCLGGGFALVASTKGFGASAPFYPPPMAKQYATIVDGACPIVASFGERDRINRGSGAKLEEVLTDKGIPHDVKTYPKAGHSFADYAPLQPVSRIMGFGQNDAAADDAWQRVFTFFREHLRIT
jgi:carboxymethylenebutenolidase